jgi:hypothetical protein
MENFIKFASVIRIGFEDWSRETKRGKIKKIIDRHIEIKQPYASLNTCFV